MVIVRDEWRLTREADALLKRFFCVRKGKTMQEIRLSICGMNTSMLTYLHVNHPNLKE